MGLDVVDHLGRGLEADWSATNYSPHLFVDLATQHLSKAALHRSLRPAEILAWTLQGDLPEQFDKLGSFGQPPVTLYRARRFVIDALFWLDGTTTIHDHAFSGAFQVLAGSSIETTFVFEVSRDIDGHLFFGDLRVRQSALRRVGDVCPIALGASYIHGLFHLERPSVTILIRSLQGPALPLQLRYEACGLAWDPFFRDPTLNRMMEVVELLERSNDPAFDELVGSLAARADLHTAYRIARACAGIQDQRRFEMVLDSIADRDAAQTMSAWFSSERVARFLRQRRALVHEPDLRFLLAVLLNSHRGDHSLKLVADYAGPDKDPAAQVASWLARLAKVKMRLQVDGSPWEPNVLNLPDFEDGHERALADSLAGRGRSFSLSERAFLDRVRALPHLAPLFA